MDLKKCWKGEKKCQCSSHLHPCLPKKNMQMFVGTFLLALQQPPPFCSSGSSSTSSMVINALSSASAWTLSSTSFRMYSSLVIPIMSKKCWSGSSWVERWGGNWMTWWPSPNKKMWSVTWYSLFKPLRKKPTLTDVTSNHRSKSLHLSNQKRLIR